MLDEIRNNLITISDIQEPVLIAAMDHWPNATEYLAHKGDLSFAQIAFMLDMLPEFAAYSYFDLHASNLPSCGALMVVIAGKAVPDLIIPAREIPLYATTETLAKGNKWPTTYLKDMISKAAVPAVFSKTLEAGKSYEGCKLYISPASLSHDGKQLLIAPDLEAELRDHRADKTPNTLL